MVDSGDRLTSESDFKQWFFDEMEKVARNYRIKPELTDIEILWDHLKGVSRDRLDKAMDSIIEREEYFPNVAVFRRHLAFTAESGEKQDFPTEWKKIPRRTEIAKASLKLINDVLDRKITREELIRGCEALDEKYPAAGFLKAAFALKNRARFIDQVVTHEDGSLGLVDRVIKRQGKVEYVLRGHAAEKREPLTGIEERQESAYPAEWDEVAPSPIQSGEVETVGMDDF